MKTKVEPKFGVGDVLKPAIDNNGLVRLHVIEVHTQSCVAGTQIKYLCRVYSSQFADEASQYKITRDYFLFNEMEVEKWTKNKENKRE